MGWYYISIVLCERNVKPQVRSYWFVKCETKTKSFFPKVRGTHKSTNCWVHPTYELMLISCGWEASLPDVGLSKSMRVAFASSAHSQSKQYLLRERYIRPQKGAF